MRLASWIKPKPAQLDLLNVEVEASLTDGAQAPTAPRASQGKPLMLAVALLCEDPHNPRTELPEAELSELAEDIRQHGVLQPIVIHPADEQGRHQIHCGAKRWRAAQRAGLTEVPVVVRDTPTPDEQQQRKSRVEMKKFESDGWQDRRRAAAWMPSAPNGRRRHGSALA